MILGKDTKFKRRGLSASSKAWLARHANDQHVKLAKRFGYRSRSAYKLIEIEEKFHILADAKLVLDLGSTPGGWCQVALKSKPQRVLAIDLLDMKPIEGITFIKGDFMEVLQNLDAQFCTILCDIAPNTTGIREADHFRSVEVVQGVLSFHEKLKQGGNLIAKIFTGGETKDILQQMRKMFTKVSIFKPKSSRAESREEYLIGLQKK